MSTYFIENRKKLYEGFLKLESATIRVVDSTGKDKISATRERLVRTHSAAVLIYNSDRDAFVFTRQFRYPISEDKPEFLLEIPAGGIDKNESPKQAAAREALEEVGYNCTNLERIFSSYSSPGTLSERIHIYYAEVSDKDHIQKGGGNSSENEEIEIQYLDRATLLSTYFEELSDAKSLLAVQWYLLCKP